MAELGQAVAAGLSTRAAQRQLEQHLKISLSQRQVHRVMQRLKQKLVEQPALELLPLAADGDEGSAAIAADQSESDAVEPQAVSNELTERSAQPVALTLTPGQSMPSRYLGLMLFYPALQVVGLLELAAQVYLLA